MFGRMFGRKKEEVVAAASKSLNRDMMEATVAGSVLVIYSNGKVDDSQVEALIAILDNNESMKHFGSEIGVTLDKFMNLMKAGATLGRIKVMREIKDCAGAPDDAIEIFATLVDVAAADDGEIDEKEQAVLKLIAKELNVNARDFGLE